MTDIAKVEQQAELALAAYANLYSGELSGQTPALGLAGLAALQADKFSEKYSVVTQYNDTSAEGGLDTGFSATVFKDSNNNLTLAIRGTLGSADLVPTDSYIAIAGAGSDQIVAMWNWWKRVSSPIGTIVQQFQVVGGLLIEPIDSVAANGSLLDALTADADHKLEVTGHSLGGHLSMAFGSFFTSQVANITVFNAPGFIDSTGVQSLFAQLGGQPPTSGSATPNNIPTTNVIADEAGIGTPPWNAIAELHSRPGIAVNIAIENQWRSDEPDPFGAMNHSQTGLTDSLVLYNTLLKLAPTFTLEQYKTVLNAATVGTAASYERTVDALQAMLGIDNSLLLSGNRHRDAFYVALYGVQDKIAALDGLAGHVIISTTTPSASSARANFGDFLALQYLTPFVLHGDETVMTALKTANENLSAAWAEDQINTSTKAANGSLNFSDTYLADRAEMLAGLILNNSNDQSAAISKKYSFTDLATSQQVLASGVLNPLVIFGHDDPQSDNIIGSSNNDHLYGMDGYDTLSGGQGDDYIEGNAGSDTLNGEEGKDKLLGGTGNDILRGGIGNDTLMGGQGNDLYDFTLGDGQDVVIDSDGNGFLRLDGVALAGGVATGDGGKTWKGKAGSLDVFYTLVKAGSTQSLYISAGNNTIEIRDYVVGTLGINLPGAEAKPGALLGDLDPVLDANGNYQYFEGTANLIVNGPKLGFNDQLFGGVGADTIKGLAGNDLLVGNDGDDDIEGGSGNDLIAGGLGFDYLSGGAGNDVILGAADIGSNNLTQSDFTTIPNGFDTLWSYGRGWQVAYNSISHVLKIPNPAYNTHLRTDNGNIINGGSGNDYVFAGGGNDVVFGDEDKDTLVGMAGNDLISGGDGDDEISGDGEAESTGDYWGETPNVAQGNDTLFGDQGNDIIIGGGGSDAIDGGSGNDKLAGDFTSSMMSNASNPSLLWQSGGNDALEGGSGNDSMWGQAGNDTLSGGDDNDFIYGDDEGAITPYVLHGQDWLDGGDGNDSLIGGGQDDTLIGGEGDDWLEGDRSGLSNLPLSYHGNDYLYGGNGSDRLFGNGGNDQLFGGDGNDALVGDRASEDLDASFGGDDVLFGEDGNDTLEGNMGNDSLYGGSGDDYLVGGEGDDTLDGGSGLDYLEGQAGNDTYIMGQARLIHDVVTAIEDNSGINRIVLGYSFDMLDIAQADNDLTFMGNGLAFNIVNGLSTGFNFTFSATNNPADSVLSFKGIMDLACREQVTFDFADDQQAVNFYGGRIQDNLSGSLLADYLDGNSGNDVLFGDAGNDTVVGDNGNDLLQGGSGSDLLNGGNGDDTLDGGIGDDSLIGGQGNDTYVIKANQGIDVITDIDGNNIFSFDSSITANNLSFIADSTSRDFIIRINGLDALRIQGGLDQSNNVLAFADGTSLTQEFVLSRMRTTPQVITGTETILST